MLTAAAAACGTGHRSGGGQLWLGVTAGGVLALGWLGLYAVAAGYPVNRNPVLRRTGAMLEGVAFLCGIGTVVAWSQLRTDQCGRIVGTAAIWEGWLFLAAVMAIVTSVLIRRPGAGWIAAAAVINADLAFLVALLGLRPAAYRQEAVVLLLVHAICTGVATCWARQLRSSPDPLPAKAAEASRILSASWIIVILLLIAGGNGRLLPDNTLIGLFVATGVSLVLGSGYTRYAEARADRRARPPEPDRVTHLVDQLKLVGDRAAAWAVRYNEHF
jgi:hypothetical protein